MINNSKSGSQQTDMGQSDGPSNDQIDAHRLMVLWLFLATLILCSILSGALFLVFSSGNKVKAPILFVVVTAGALGGFVSCLRRLYKFEDIFPKRDYAVLFRKLNIYLLAYSTIPSLIGMVPSVVVYLVFAAGMISGPIFPEFDCADINADCTTFPNFLRNWSPECPQDYAKVIVWGFMAGFSERFFVDILNQFVSKAKDAGSDT